MQNFNLKDIPPPNMFVLNDDYDAENLLYFIKKQKINQQNSNLRAN